MREEILSPEDEIIFRSGRLDGIDILKYLNLYVSSIDWQPIVKSLWSLPIQPRERWKRLAFVIGVMQHDSSAFNNVDLNNVFNWCFKWNQYNLHSWLVELVEIYEKDKEIEKSRQKCLDLGIVYPLHYNPITRQAFNWLVAKAQENELTIESTVSKEKLQNVVYIYGGTVVCSIFEKPELGTKINKIPNWRSGYFFERLIYEVYSEQQLLEIKTHEINKLKNSGSNLVKYIMKAEGANGDT